VSADLLSLAVPAAVAVIGLGVKYRNDLAIARRKDQLERTNQQLRRLYGPLYAIERAEGEAWAAFRSLYRSNKSFWKSDPPPSAAEQAAWRLWMVEVFHPMNLRMERVIIENADLLEDDQIPECLLALCAHVAAYKAVLKQWEQGDYSRNLSVIDFPRQALREYVTSRYNDLKFRQGKLLSSLGERKAVASGEGPSDDGSITSA
jgi:hypothetical protein